MKHTLPNLTYDYDALEPMIDQVTMKIHHTKHHQAYVDQLNLALDKHPELYDQPLETLLKNIASLPEDIQTAVRNHGGGHYNHSFFWTILEPNQGHIPHNEITKAISDTFGSWTHFEEQFKKAALTRFGSGWVWLIQNDKGELIITSTPNQDTPLNQGRVLIGLDVWEHAYYLNYQNRRGDYIQAFFQIINWKKVNEYFLQK